MIEENKILKEKYLSLKLNEAIDYEKFSMISFIYHSTKIEGLSLSETDTQVLLDKEITAKGKPLKDHLMVKDHFNALKFLINESKNKRKLSLEFLQETAAILMKNTGDLVKTPLGDYDISKGDLRLSQVYVDKKYFPNFQKVPNLLDNLLNEVNKRLDAVKGIEITNLAADFHYNLVNIHPFGDGNGRISRLFMNYILLYHKEPISKIFSEDRADYIIALNETEEKDDLNIFREFIISQQNKFFELEIIKFTKKDSGFKILF